MLKSSKNLAVLGQVLARQLEELAALMESLNIVLDRYLPNSAIWGKLICLSVLGMGLSAACAVYLGYARILIQRLLL